MVLPYLVTLCCDRYGCFEEDVTLSARWDDLNLTADDLNEIALCLNDVYGIEIPGHVLSAAETVEDLVGYVEDRL